MVERVLLFFFLVLFFVEVISSHGCLGPVPGCLTRRFLGPVPGYLTHGYLGPFPDCLTQGYLGPFRWHLATALGHLRSSLLASNLTSWCGVETKCSTTSMFTNVCPHFFRSHSTIVLSAFIPCCLFDLHVGTRTHTCHGIAWFPLVVAHMFWGFLARGANCTNVHLARLIAGVKKASLDVQRHIPCQRNCRCSRFWCVPTRIAVERSNEWHVFEQSRRRSLRAVA